MLKRGRGALVLPHLNDVFVDVNQWDLAIRLVEIGQFDVLAKHLHHFKKRSLDIYIADALAQAGYGDEVMSMYKIFLCPPDDLRVIVTSGLGRYVEREQYALKENLSQPYVTSG